MNSYSGIAKKPERTNYFNGQLLTLADLERDQQYLRDRLRRHNRLAHGWGVIHGLHVGIEGGDILVAPGFAIDCEGNELEVVEQQRIAIGTLATSFYVGIKFLEIPSTPVQGPNGLVNATIIETAEIELSTENACLGHKKLGPGTPGCGQSHAVVLANVKPRQGDWQIKQAKNSA
ncbi:hypothetical protein [Methylomonas fluvii]|uniref:Uncharacterized protein n=1 Tax=Methylomonas fluvii TaxID=1854564 RepID=A0ABR9DGY7_9GAMM|nr:hypothetical protein [Methylomonas fluvii]MBD9362367.1 hypothetical protein [Methylomonas fluvii]